jgi:phosphatidylserine decarboxylase
MSLAVTLQHWLPHRLLARVVYAASRSRRAWLKRPLIRWFARHYRIDVSEAVVEDLEAYACFNDFFTRALKDGSRTPTGDEHTIVSPVDGRLTEFGEIAAGELIQAKGLGYSLEALLGEGPVEASRFTRGSFATIYLAPHDYHRVHMPLSGRLLATRYIPGRRYSVNAVTTAGIRNLFCRNERVVCWFDTPAGPMALVLVGALNVSSVSTVSRGEIESGPPRYWPERDSPLFRRGDEIGRFNLGSTVVLILANGAAAWHSALRQNDKLRLGDALGKVVAADAQEAGDARV